MKKLNKIIRLFVASIMVHIFIFSAYSQSLTLMPKDTEFLDKREQKQSETTIETYRFHSQSSVEQINEFYKQMFSNDGFKESKQSGSNKRILVFLKADSIVLLNFVPDYEDKDATYYNIQIQKFPANVKVDGSSLQQGKN